MEKESKIFPAAPNTGNDVDLTNQEIRVENVAEPTQGSTNQSPDDTATSDEEATTAAYGEQVTASTNLSEGALTAADEQVQADAEANDGDDATSTAAEGNEATADTMESYNAVQGGENTSAEQDSQATQAITGASPEEQESGKKSAGKKTSSMPKKTKPAPDFSLNYSDEKKKELERVTKVGDAEIKRVREDPRFPAIPFGDNAIINLKEAALNGVRFKTPKVNRKHGKDESATGESLMKHGAQHPFIVITEKMAEAAGIKVTRFSNDDPTKPFNGSGYTLIILDGNGRCNFILGLEGGPEKWPDVYAIFPTKNRAGFYDIPKSFEVMNTQVTVWKPGDLMIKRILEEGSECHPGWKAIKKLEQKGYKYQAACELMTLRTDRVTTNEITSGSAQTIFVHYKSAVKIHNALVKKFCEGDDNTLKTKAFPAKVSELWLPLSSKSGDEKATEYMIAFIDQFPQEQVKKIMEAKGSKKDGVRVTKDAIRIGILETEFNAYMEKHPFNTEK